MSKLTKEECLKYKSELQFAYDHVGTRLDDVSMKDAISLGIVGYEKLMNEHFDNKLTNDEIDFLLISEEERVNTYKNYEDIWKSCVSKLEMQKEIMEDE